MINTGRDQAAAWSFRIDLRKIGMTIGWILFAAAALTIFVLYVLAFTRPDMSENVAMRITIGVAVGFGVSAVVVWGFTISLRAVADTIDAYQQGVRDAVAHLAEAMPEGEVHQFDARRRGRHLRSTQLS